MKVAKKSPKKRSAAPPARATLTLDIGTYRKIDTLRGEMNRAAWVQDLIEREQERRDREAFVDLVRQQYTPEVCRETLVINEEYPIHEA
ncbi:MAG: hypothetical protein ABIZ56_01880 [Chthoniobacteraceae bacterium]